MKYPLAVETRVLPGGNSVSVVFRELDTDLTVATFSCTAVQNQYNYLAEFVRYRQGAIFADESVFMVNVMRAYCPLSFISNLDALYYN